jgi:hypothetical protein
MSLHDRQRAGISQTLGESRGTLDVGEQDGPERGGDPWLPWRRLLEPAEKVDHGTPVDLDDLVRDESVRLTVDRFGGLRARRVGQTEDRTGRGIEPVRHVAHAVLLLDFQVPDVSLGDVLGRGLREVVSIHVQGHRSLRLAERPYYALRTERRQG